MESGQVKTSQVDKNRRDIYFQNWEAVHDREENLPVKCKRLKIIFQQKNTQLFFE